MDQDDVLLSLGVEARPALLYFPPGCKKGVEYSSVLVVGQPEPPTAWVRRRMAGSVCELSRFEDRF